MSEINNLTNKIDWSKLTLADDFFFGYAMKNARLCKEFLEILLNTKIAEIQHLQIQGYEKENINEHGVLLDVKLVADGKVINVEMQTTNEKDLELRSRYYQALTDAHLLDKGKPYTDLPEFLTIFICTFDYFKEGLPLYTFQNTIKELNHKEFGDKRKILVYNTRAYKNAFTEEQKGLLNFITGGEPTSQRVRGFAKDIDDLKKESKFKEEYMNYYLKTNEMIYKAKAEGIKIGIQQGMAEQKLKDETLILQQKEDLLKQAEQIKLLKEQLATLKSNTK